MYPSVTTIYGEPGTIKSSLALDWPKPLVFYDLEHGGHRAWRWIELIASGDVTVREFNIPHKSMIERYSKLSGYIDTWGALAKTMEEDLANFATVVWDTGTVVWALDRDCVLEEVQKVTPARRQLLQIEYGEPNRRMTELLNLAKAFQTNLVITHHETDEYTQLIDPLGRPMLDENNNPISVTTGRKVPEGFKHTIGLSDWVLRTTLATVTSGSETTRTPRALIEKSAYGLHLLGIPPINWPTYNKLSALTMPIPYTPAEA